VLRKDGGVSNFEISNEVACVPLGQDEIWANGLEIREKSMHTAQQ